MSRIGRLPIDIPAGVDITIAAGNNVTVKGPKGTLTQSFNKDIMIEKNGSVVEVKRPSEQKEHRALHGLTRALLSNMVTGVTKGFEKVLEISGVGYRAQKQGNKVVLTLGYSHPVEMIEPAGITVDVPTQTQLIIKGIDKQAVGQFAAEIRSKREPEVYKGKGIKYAGEIIRRKEGKTGGKK